MSRFRPIHSNFETLRVAGLSAPSHHSYHRLGSASTEQLSARGTARMGRIGRPAAVFADFREV